MINSDLAEKKESADSFALWQARRHASVSEAALEKRKNELYALVRRVVKNELTPLQQQIVHLLWYENKSVAEAAEDLRLDRSSVFRKEKQINEIIYDKLKYAMEYRYGRSFSEKTIGLIHENSAACCPVEGRSISERLRSLRLKQCLENKDISTLTGIRKSRLDYLEKEGDGISADELSRLSRLYGTTADYIINGKKGVIQ